MDPTKSFLCQAGLHIINGTPHTCPICSYNKIVNPPELVKNPPKLGQELDVKV